MENKAMNVCTIVIGKDFSDTPGGRYPADGPWNGQKFREECLIPALRTHDKVVVDVSGVEGYGSSFLEEVFGGIVRANIMPKAELVAKLSWIASDATKECYLGRIETYFKAELEKQK